MDIVCGTFVLPAVDSGAGNHTINGVITTAAGFMGIGKLHPLRVPGDRVRCNGTKAPHPITNTSTENSKSAYSEGREMNPPCKSIDYDPPTTDDPGTAKSEG